MNSCPIKIGLDFHGVVSSRPEYFSRFSELAKNRRYEVHIITGGPEKIVKKMLDEWHIYYTNIFAILDYYDSLGEVEYYPSGEFKVPDKLWNSAKAEYCLSKGINMHVDDSEQYAKWFMTPYCCYDGQSKQCRTAENFIIDFSKTPEVALEQIEKAVKTHQYF